MSELTTFEWSLEKIVWFLNFLLGIFDSIIGWASKHADEEVHKDLKNLAKEIDDTRQHLLHWLREDN